MKIKPPKKINYFNNILTFKKLADNSDKLSAAKALFDSGAKKFKNKDFAGAIADFKESHRLSNRPGLIYSIAQSYTLDFYEKNNGTSLNEAINYYKKYLNEPVSQEKKEQANYFLSELEKINNLNIKVNTNVIKNFQELHSKLFVPIQITGITDKDTLNAAELDKKFLVAKGYLSKSDYDSNKIGWDKLINALKAFKKDSLPKETESAQDKEEQAKKIFEQGAKKYDSKDYSGAIKDFQSSYNMSQRPGLLFSIAQCYRKLHETEKNDNYRLSAVKYYKEYLTPANIGSLSLRNNQSISEAVKYLAILDTENNESAKSKFAEGSKYFEQGKYQEALVLFGQAFSQTRRPSLIFSIAQCYRKLYESNKDQNNLELAIQNYNYYIIMDPSGDRVNESKQYLSQLE